MPKIPHWVSCLLIVFVCFLANYKSLGCFFFADDFLSLEYLQKAFNGEPDIFWKRLVSPWFEPDIVVVYRPLCDLFFFLDYFFWKSDPFGYHLTNLILACISSIALYFTVEELCFEFPRVYARCCAILSACIFAVHPLHVEPVVWLVARADLLACAFGLSSMLFAFRAFRQGKTCSPASLVFFAAAVFSKEAAISFIAIIFAYLLLMGKAKAELSEIPKRISPFLLLALAYIIFRCSLLGTPLGGYAFSFGDSLADQWMQRVFDLNIYALVGLGTNLSIFRPASFEMSVLHAIFIGMGGLLLLRTPVYPWDARTSKLLAFFVFAALSALLPAFQVLGVSGTLNNARVFYLASAFFIPFVVIALLPSPPDDHVREEDEGSGKLEIHVFPETFIFFASASTLLLAGLIVVFAWISLKSYSPWLEGSRILLRMQALSNEALSRLEKGKKLVLIKYCSNWKGAHLSYLGRELKVILGPNFFPAASLDGLLPLDEFPGFVTASTERLNRYLKDGRHEIFCFDARRLSLEPVRQPVTETALSNAAILDGRISQLPSDNKRYRLFSVDFSEFPSIGDSSIVEATVFWKGEGKKFAEFCFADALSIPREEDIGKSVVSTDGGLRKIHFSSFELREMIGANPAGKLLVWLNPESELLSVKMIGGAWCASLSPELSTVEEMNNGNYRPRNGAVPKLRLDVSRVPGARAMLLEEAQPNYLFRLGYDCVRDPQEYGRLAMSRRFDCSSANFTIPESCLKPGSRHAFRLLALDSSGKALGFYSDTVCVDLRDN